jgi:pimeloyl-ACP methyl ester carboxylesterase
MIPLTASQVDQRLSYCLYVPTTYDPDAEPAPLAVLMHGTGRAAEHYRAGFADFAERTGCVLLAPLFPAGIGTPGEINNFKYFSYAGIRFDEVVLAMVDEVSQLYRIRSEKFLLFGFSGGGHFTHRFLYLHPERLLAATIGAPGVVTLPDETAPWPAGLSDVDTLFGIRPDWALVRQVPVQLVIGDRDTETWEISLKPDMPGWIAGVNDVGVTRLAKMAVLREKLEGLGVSVRQDIVPGVAHDGLKMFPTVQTFFTDILGR